MDKAAWERAVAFHGHACPGLALGVRLCEYVLKTMDWTFSEDEQLVCIAETDSCPVDAIQAILGCTFGKGNLLYRPAGKTAYNFYCRATGASIRIVARRNKTELSREDRIRQILESPLEELYHHGGPVSPAGNCPDFQNPYLRPLRRGHGGTHGPSAGRQGGLSALLSLL